ncbi:ATP-dependent zinc metalloprotease FtsH [Thermoactinomyces sp. DSM 45892]|uniref:ATP-dependent zinc metalloprotease FtsH n=1 Tax=Thermoactinomyces sp. DSM 45892 TaxID=1882753 RepID=UPI00089B4814|nr:ATP-dependent zinc metalloprotease FtsH [Thermoactinomyces sp. DSM 45892]SDY94645.1 cell division protease FtsH [Thermoactinomyces sp. DSM 45892]
MKNFFLRNGILYAILILVTIGVVNLVANSGNDLEQLNTTQFKQKIEQKQIIDAKLLPEGFTYRIDGKMKDPKDPKKTKMYSTQTPMMESDIVKLLETNQISYTTSPPKQESIWVTALSTIIPLVIVLLLFFFLLNNAQGGGNRVMNFGKSKARLYNDEKKRVTFHDVAGADEEKQELVEIVDFLKDNRRFVAMGARIPKGVLLVGPPGTGKTLLARAVAGEAKVPFFSISGSDFVEMFVGVGASRVRDLFEQAKKNAPCIIFIDEIDAVGRQRGAGLGGGHDEREQTLNQLLVEMDGFDGNSGIIMIAATNRPDILDPALLRPGRFDRQILVSRPDVKGREAILKVHARNKPIAESVKLKVIAQRTTGFSGADLENLLNEAALLAARENKKKITMDEVDEAVDRVIAGPAKKSRVVSEKERKIVAYHEAGHAIVGYYVPNADIVHKVTIVPRGQAGGYVMSLPKEDRYLATKGELLDRVTGILGGRVAEEIIFGEVSTGASNDFEKATAIVRSMITEYGMSDRLATMQFGRSQGQVFLGRDIGHEQNYSDQVAYEIDSEMQELIRTCYKRAMDILNERRDQLELLAQTLLSRETLDEEQIKQLLDTGKIDDKPVDDDVKVNIQGKEELDVEPSIEEKVDEAPETPNDLDDVKPTDVDEKDEKKDDPK